MKYMLEIWSNMYKNKILAVEKQRTDVDNQPQKGLSSASALNFLPSPPRTGSTGLKKIINIYQ
jgi:hypothetical protein